MTELRVNVFSTKLRSCRLSFTYASSSLLASSETLSDDDFASAVTLPDEDFSSVSSGDFARFASSDSSTWSPPASNARFTSSGSSESSPPSNVDRVARSAEAPVATLRRVHPGQRPTMTSVAYPHTPSAYQCALLLY